jgi:diguanylate cyclase (GGDEF)-like protein
MILAPTPLSLHLKPPSGCVKHESSGWLRMTQMASGMAPIRAGTLHTEDVNVNWRGIAGRTAELKDSQINLIEANRRLSDLAVSDFLTGVLNRRGFFERASAEMARHKRKSQPFCVLLIDLDDFKRINDTFGHDAGDLALRLVADAFRLDLRPTDLLARYGGEEFIILLPESTEKLAMPLAERLRVAVERIELLHNDQGIVLTVSIGVANSATASDLNAAIVEADRNLYAAKMPAKIACIPLHAFERYRTRV